MSMCDFYYSQEVILEACGYEEDYDMELIPHEEEKEVKKKVKKNIFLSKKDKKLKKAFLWKKEFKDCPF